MNGLQIKKLDDGAFKRSLIHRPRPDIASDYFSQLVEPFARTQRWIN